MYDLYYPPDWQEFLLGDLCNIQIGGTPARNEARFWATNNDGYNWVAISDLDSKWITKTQEQITDLGIERSNVKFVPQGTLLLSFKLTIGRVGFAGIDLYTNEAIAALFPKTRKVWIPWLYHALPLFLKGRIAEQAVKGQTLNKKNLRMFPIYCPHDKEQRHISTILDTIDTQIQCTEQLIAKLKRQREGLLHDLLTCGLDEDGELRDPEVLPKEWAISRVDDLGLWRGGSTPSKALASNWVEGDILWISPKDLQDKEIDDSQDKITSQALSAYRLTLFEENSIIVVFRSGILRHTFPVCIVKSPFTVNQDIKVLTPRSDVNYKFAFFALQGLSYRVLKSAVKAGTTVESIDLLTFLNLPVFIPPRDEQVRIVAILDAIDNEIHTESSDLAKLKHYKQGLMHDLLTGSVRVGMGEEWVGDEA